MFESKGIVTCKAVLFSRLKLLTLRERKKKGNWHGSILFGCKNHTERETETQCTYIDIAKDTTAQLQLYVYIDKSVHID